MQKQHSDKRQIERHSVDMLLNKYVRGRPYLCHATNISRDGMWLRTVSEPLHSPSAVGLQFQLPGTDHVIVCSGTVIPHSEDPSLGHGVRFTDIDPEHQDVIDDYFGVAISKG